MCNSNWAGPSHLAQSASSASVGTSLVINEVQPRQLNKSCEQAQAVSPSAKVSSDPKRTSSPEGLLSQWNSKSKLNLLFEALPTRGDVSLIPPVNPLIDGILSSSFLMIESAANLVDIPVADNIHLGLTDGGNRAVEFRERGARTRGCGRRRRGGPLIHSANSSTKRQLPLPFLLGVASHPRKRLYVKLHPEEWQFTGFYGELDYGRRQKAWNVLRSLGHNSRGRCVTLGCPIGCSIGGLGFSRPSFTWCNRRLPPDTLAQQSVHMVEHQAVFFKFEASWICSKECAEVISDLWKDWRVGESSFPTLEKLRYCSENLTIWRRCHLGVACKRVKWREGRMRTLNVLNGQLQ
ncbi:hypothetical protein Salat_1104600 [Sesamum alatum]|uniref:Uncharacterized protein n=1 Tax=Sesamum alatum TaxID=300844 RepID=A0AAE1YPL9_9LAMI|nr:hypothetical protein Salat_1104600 [Sesamum alatum]